MANLDEYYTDLSLIISIQLTQLVFAGNNTFLMIANQQVWQYRRQLILVGAIKYIIIYKQY